LSSTSINRYISVLRMLFINPEANGMKEHPKNLGNCRVLEELRRVSSHAKNGTVRSVSGWPYPCKDSGVPSPQNATIAQ
ncbi:MAG TPA: hypothetical protein VK775_04895, partial [Chthoniobacterales bacterium]|nr:hypothetical protein [Chthoniobacterales bacterium]